MDPQATLDRMLEAVRLGEADEAGEALDDLVDWMARGGRAPDVDAALAKARARGAGTTR